MKKLVILGIVSLLLVMALAIAMPVAAGGPGGKGNSGFDQYGYNYQARVFVGIGEDWYRGKIGSELGPWQEGQEFLWDETYGRDHLVLKWSKAWDDARFHGGEWGPQAWCTNEWNGMSPGGSQEVWHYKNIWVGPELENSPYWREGGYPIWGQFEVIMSHGVADGEHIWDTLATPCGFGGP